MYVIIAGGGLIGRGLIEILVANRHDIVVIERAKDICDTIYSEMGATTICGSATDVRVIEEAGAKNADVLVAVMGSDADNIACGLIAKSLGIPRVIGRLRNPKYQKAYQLAGMGIVRAADLVLNQLLMQVEQPKVKRIMLIAEGKAGIYSIRIPENGESVGKTVEEIGRDSRFPQACVFMGIYKEEEGEFHIPRGGNVFKTNDRVFLISKSEFIKQAADYLTRIR